MLLRTLYTFLLTLAAPFLLYGLYRRRQGKPSVGKRWKEHFGITPQLKTAIPPIWIHAASVGETLAVTPLIKQIKQRSPNTPILLTTTTPTGAEQAEKLADWVEHRYTPIDFSFAVRGFLHRVRPCQLIIVETELWPNTLHTVAKAGLPITLVNARLSEKSYRGYQRIRPFFNGMTKHLSLVLCQFADDAQRFIQLGMAEKKIKITGSIKFDIALTDDVIAQGEALRTALGKHRPIWIAASTHQGEDEIVLAAHQEILKQHPNALLILVPRHPERFAAVHKLAASLFSVQTRSSQQIITSDTQVYLGDTMGEMLVLLGASDVCFMGGSLVGKKVGGHNLLEPAALAKPIITGPSFYNFTDITHALMNAHACVIADQPETIVKQVNHWFADVQERQQCGKNALEIVMQNRGALENTLIELGFTKEFVQ
ncbi:3-deoxy-D-manno-octulosonic-acid transferase [Vibrio mimicus]|uniref:lipid IV(A) 3-deoxy-D-manno-octulosonic acid transferase n=1 Tax=Vibrio mimicus TaxID=674 RepID=UPI0002BC7BAD|nr:lipid IV(A) 3-deoxy-D-manno-octulosonic acid transferase [Vibrio mimicus]EMB49889.1 3-deoxy-D-manno-octulosonic-acid transferase [Vibrio mimicus CAIM 602]MBY7675943.1 lipid IV(A) 3-deoxy-D-manno-octulosonic acid transferase [Vibrio mimicus]MBY7727803.1 lipid IV(A) 3-deoxy-D-manno-octulosonic acid transferase [Vibrio mimicus]SUP15911.1 3-deoxy-D-manno-octulosonic-acid transferase [Vibrio mimicus]